MALVAARQADAGRLCPGWRAGAAGVQSLSLHRALRGETGAGGAGGYGAWAWGVMNHRI